MSQLGDTPTIAMVDDDESVRMAMADMVESLGYKVVAFASGAEVLGSDRLHDVACLITDVRMSGMTGFELHDRLIAAGRMIPTIFLTAFPQEKGKNRATKAGAVCYLSKPCQRVDLLACLHSALAQVGGKGR
jgi:FixJ family two-component response regulator